MKVFVAGASGALGRPLLRQLLAAGHEVTGTTRGEERAETIRAAGATASVVDALDSLALNDAVAAAEPEVVVHALTALPDRIEWKHDPLGPTNRLREEGTRNLIEAARAAGAKRLLAESVEGLILRYGWLYGPGTHFAADGFQAADTRKRRLPIVGKGQGTFSFVHVEDAASATVAALDRGAPGPYNVVDDDPSPMREWVPAYAEALGAKPPRRQRQGQARARLAASLPELAPGLPRGAGLSQVRCRRPD